MPCIWFCLQFSYCRTICVLLWRLPLFRAVFSGICDINQGKNCGPQLSHQNQMLTANYKSLTSNSNRSQQIQIAHSELQITHSKLQNAHSKFKSRLRLSTASGATRNLSYMKWSRYSVTFACVNLRDSCGPLMDCVMPLSLCFNQNVFQGV